MLLSFVRGVSGGKGVQITCEEHRLKTVGWGREDRGLEKARQGAVEGQTVGWRRHDRGLGKVRQGAKEDKTPCSTADI